MTITGKVTLSDDSYYNGKRVGDMLADEQHDMAMYYKNKGAKCFEIRTSTGSITYNF